MIAAALVRKPRSATVAAFALVLAVDSPAQGTASLADLSLEQLSNILVTSVSRYEQRLADAPASIYVITNDDIRRAGVRTLAEALRLAPNLQVARADANQYAITARGFGNVLANKLLVLIDGRTVYSPLFSGVFWEARDVMIEDIDRIEVIDGPQSTLWGTNAVNGTINVITKPAAATQGTLVALGGGNRDRAAAARYGGTTPDGGHFRVYGRRIEHEDTRRADRGSVDDASKRWRAGFRYDGFLGNDAITIQGDAYTGDIDQPAGQRDIAGGNVLARWQRTLERGDTITVQAYYDRSKLDQATFRDDLDTFDLEAQGRFRVGAASAVLVGAGYRHQRDRVRNGVTQAFIPADRDLDTAYAFVQHEHQLSEQVALIAGIKAEHNDYTGVEYLPNARIGWRPVRDHMFWAALSRSVRAPSRIDRELFVPGAPPFLLAGGPGFASEEATVVEAGARGRLAPQLSYSATAFRHEHDRLRSIEAGPRGLVFANGIDGSTTGFEAWFTWHPSERWRLSAGGVEMRQRLRPAAGVVDLGGIAQLGNDPKRSLVLRSSFEFGDRQELDVLVRHVGERPNPVVPRYTAVDIRWGWQATPMVELSLTLENLTDARHPEWGAAANRVEFERAWFLKALVRL